ncbi:MAG: RnfH family protein [Aquabacterium sp.]|nr:RnfH family protein [Aquabacterium sp.]
MAPVEPQALRIEVLFSPAARAVWSRIVTLSAGAATVGQALQASGLLQEHPRAASCALALWGRACGADALLRDGDRIEVLRELTADPKESRRLRYRGQPARRAAKRAAAGAADSAAEALSGSPTR